MPRGRPKKAEPSIFPDPALNISVYAKQTGVPRKLGKMRGWKSPLDWDYSACDEVTRNILDPKCLEEALRNWHASRIKNGIAKHPEPVDGKTANQIRKEQSEERRKEIFTKYPCCFNKTTDSEIARCITREMIKKDETPPELRTLRKYVAIAKKLAQPNLIKN